jgi:hypothetical protein
MTRKDWQRVADNQFNSLDQDIRDDWSDLHQLTSGR